MVMMARVVVQPRRCWANRAGQAEPGVVRTMLPLLLLLPPLAGQA